MHKGIEFNNKKINASMSESIAESAESTYSFTGDFETTTSCPTPSDDPSTTEIGYFIWVVDSGSGDSSAIQQLGVCRYGEGYWNVAPDCPFAACIDGQCK